MFMLYSELDMDLLCWGSGELGQTGCGRLGDIGPEESHMRGFTVARLGTVKLLACGSSHSIVVTVDNKIFAWGNGTSGQLGDGERALKDQPVEVKLPQELTAKRNEADVNLVNIVGVACGSRHSFIWTETGQAYSFGNNFYAQLGYDFQRADFKEHQLAPCLFRNLPSSLKISQVACGERHTLFALEDGSVAACGQNDYGQIGSGSDENAVVPRFVECVGQVSKVTCGANHNLVLTAGGRLFQWGCGRACGNIKKNILFPEEVTLPNMPVRDIAGGYWHSLLLTDGGNVFSWGMGQEGQLGLGEDRIHISTPCLLSYSQLTKVTQIQAGDSYSAAVTAGGELFLWGQIPCVSRVSDHPGLRRLWTPQPVPLADRKVCDVATGTWHIMVLAKRSREKNRECVHPETEACFRDAVSNPPPTEKEKENTVQDLYQVQHKLLQGEDGRVGFKEQEKDEQSESAEEEERHEQSPNKDEGDGASQSSAFAIARSATKTDWRGNSQSSIKSDQRDEREGCRTVRPWEVRKELCRGRDVVFTTLHLLPRPKGEQCGHTASTLPPLLTGQQSHSRVLAEARKERSTHLTELVQKSGSDRIIVQDSKLRPKPPGRYTGLGAQRAASCLHSRLHPDLKSPVHCSCPHPNPQQVQFSSISTHLGSCETGLCPATSSSEPFRYCPTHRRVVSSQGTCSKDL